MKTIYITIKPTDACNMRCKHCYHAEVGFDRTVLDLESAKKILDIASSDYDLISILFIGGEPTLFGLNNFKEILEHQKHLTQTKSIKFINKIQTNGILLNKEWVDFFIKNEFHVGISYDGPHNSDLRTHGSIVLKNILYAKERGLKLGVLCVENNESIKSLLITYEWFKANKLDFKILPLFIAGNAKKYSLLELEATNYVKELIDVYKFWLYDKNCNIDMSTFQSFLRISDKMLCIHMANKGCISKRVAITSNGDMYPCGRPYTNDFNMGHIDEFNSINDMFKTKAYSKLLTINFDRMENCKKCEVFSACKGGCISNAILENSFSEINNPTCIKTKKLLTMLFDINKDIYKKFDAGCLENINPQALNIIKKIRQTDHSLFMS